MNEPVSSPSVLSHLTQDEGLLCPACGYDLRGSPSDRCSECGMVVDRAALCVSAFPWAQRKQLGRFRAYRRTLWQVTIGSRKLAWEAAKPQSLADARRFRWVTGSLTSVAFLAVFFYFATGQNGLRFLAFGPPAQPVSWWATDFVVPWSAGATSTLVMSIMVAAMGFWITDACPAFRSADDSSRQERADAIACFATAGMAWLIGIVPWLVLDKLLSPLWSSPIRNNNTIHLMLKVVDLLAVVSVVVLTVGVLSPLMEVARWVVRVKHCGRDGALLAVAQLLGWWLLGALILLVVLPWGIGFFWLVIDSFR